MDQTIYLLQNTDPADASPDGPELITLEGTRKTLPELLFNVDTFMCWDGAYKQNMTL